MRLTVHCIEIISSFICVSVGGMKWIMQESSTIQITKKTKLLLLLWWVGKIIKFKLRFWTQVKILFPQSLKKAFLVHHEIFPKLNHHLSASFPCQYFPAAIFMKPASTSIYRCGLGAACNKSRSGLHISESAPGLRGTAVRDKWVRWAHAALTERHTSRVRMELIWWRTLMNRALRCRCRYGGYAGSDGINVWWRR